MKSLSKFKNLIRCQINPRQYFSNKSQKLKLEEIESLAEKLDIDNDADDLRMDAIHVRQKIAIQNWKKIGIRVIVLRSLAFNIVDPESTFEGKDKDVIKKSWYESGAYVIKPSSIWYMVWDVTKSVMYMISLYTLAYAAAFKYQSDDSAADFEFVVDLIQIVDIIHVFFCATKVQSLS